MVTHALRAPRGMWKDILYPPAGTTDALYGPWVRKKVAEAEIAKLQKKHREEKMLLGMHIAQLESRLERYRGADGEFL